MSDLAPIGRTVLDQLADTYRKRVLARIGLFLTASPSWLDLTAAAVFARDLMAGDEANFKAGYSVENAVLAAGEVFVDVADDAIANRLNALKPTHRYMVEVHAWSEDEARRLLLAEVERDGWKWPLTSTTVPEVY